MRLIFSPSERPFFFGSSGFFASCLGVEAGEGVGDGDGDGDGSTVGLGLAMTAAAGGGAIELRDLIASVNPNTTNAATKAAMIFRFVRDLSVPLTDTENLGK